MGDKAMLRVRGMRWFAVVAAVVAGCAMLAWVPAKASSATATASATNCKSKVAGKKIGFNEIQGAAVIERRWSNQIKYISKALGWKYQFLDARGTSNKALTNQRTMANNGTDAIFLNSMPSEWVRPATALLKQKKIPTINLITPATPGVYDADIDENAKETSNKMADQVIADVKRGGKIALVNEEGIESLRQREAILKKRFAAAGVDVVATGSVPVTNEPGAAKTTVDILNAHPETKAIVSISSSLMLYILQGLRQAGKSNLPVYSWYADSGNLKALEANSNLRGLVDSDIGRAGFVAVDRLLDYWCAGKPLGGQRYLKSKAVFVTRAKAKTLPSLKTDQGPIPYEKLGASYFKRWKQVYGIGSGKAPRS